LDRNICEACKPGRDVLARIYTKAGDDGTTALIGGKKVAKDAARVDAYGSVDELNAILGVVRSQPVPEHLDAVLGRIQDHLFTLGANLALPDGVDPGQWNIPRMSDEDTAELERAIDESEKTLEPLKQFIIPGGSPQGAMLHLARTVARRAERCCVALSHNETVDPAIIRYLNRLSDLCFVLAREINRSFGSGEAHPTFGRQ
jgi:cob(I)alamin adenosyltransferase